MSDIDMDGALEALSADLPDSVSEASVSDMTVEDNQFDAEPFTSFDPDTLPEDMQAVYRSMQGDYTRKTQEIAELRRNYEAFSETGVDPNDAVEAVHLWQRMYNDPEFAMQVTQGLQNRLEEMGYAQQNQIQDSPIVNNESYEGVPPALMAELEEMRAFRQEMMEHQSRNELVSELEAVETTIRTTNPQYTDDDMEAIYSLAYATQGDLMAAQEQYAAIQQRLLGNYLQAKTVPHGATPAPSVPSSIPPKEFSSVDEAHKAALERLRNIS
jgi:hypothetical protein